MSKVTVEIKDGIAIVTLDNVRKLNALTVAMLDGLNEACDAIEHNNDVRSVIVTGAGPKAFCCGADIGEWSDLSATEFARHWVRRGHRVFDRLARLHVPTIAALNGHAFGGGLELASACDIRVMSPEATLALPEARVGVVPGWSGTQRLARLMPEPMVKEMALFGRRIDAKRAFRSGYVAEIADDAVAAAKQIASELKGLSPRSVEISKNMIHAARNEDAAAITEALGSAAIAASDDLKEGIAAFKEKRPAEFSGR